MATIGDTLFAIDGDTIKDDGESVRIAGVDAPETGKHGADSAPLATEAKRLAAEFVADPDVQRAPDQGTDVYGRTIGDMVNTRTGETLGQNLARKGVVTTGEFDDPNDVKQSQLIGNLSPEQSNPVMRDLTIMRHEALSSQPYEGNIRVRGSTLERGIRRGLDSTQLGIAYLLDDKQAIQRNLDELQRNAPEIGSVGNIDSVGDAFTWSLEVLGSQIPQLAIDAGFAVAGTITGGMGATGIVARRAGMQAAKKALMNNATKEVAAKAARDAAFDHFKKVAATGAKFGGAVGIYGQSVGESMSQIRGDGAEYLPALATSLGISVPQAALEYAGLGRALSDVARATGLSKSAMEKTVAARLGEMVKTMGVEGGTEAMQTALDLGANLALNGAEFDWNELMDAAAAGALMGGVFSGVGHVVGGGYEAAKARINRDLTLTEESIQRESQAPTTTAEPISDIRAQVADMLNPETSRDSVFVSDANELSEIAVPEGVSLGRVEGGVLLTNNPDLAQQMYSDPAGAKAQFESRYVTPKSTMTNHDFEHGTVVQRVNEQGDVVDEQLTTPQNANATKEILQQDLQPGEQIVETNAEQAQAVRAEKVDGQQDTRHEAPRPESGMDRSVRQLRPDNSVGANTDADRGTDLSEVQASSDQVASVAHYKAIGDYFDAQGQGFNPTAVDPAANPNAVESQAKQENLTESSEEDLSDPVQQAFSVVSRVIPQTGVFGTEVSKRETTLRDAFPMLDFERVEVQTDVGKQRYTFKPVFKKFPSIQHAKQFVAENLSDFDDYYYQYKNGELVPLRHAAEIRPTPAASTLAVEMYNKAKQQATLDKSGERSWLFNGVKLHLPTITEYGRKELNDPQADDLSAFEQGVGTLGLEGYFPAEGLFTAKGVKKGKVISTRKEAVTVGQLVAQKEAEAKKGRGGDELIDPEDFDQAPITEQEVVDRVKEKDIYKNNQGRFAEDNAIKGASKGGIEKRALRVEKKSLEAERKRLDGVETLKATQERERLDKKLAHLEQRINEVVAEQQPVAVSEKHRAFVDYAGSLLGGKTEVSISYEDLGDSSGRVMYNADGQNKHRIVIGNKVKDTDEGYFILAHEFAHLYVAKLAYDPEHHDRLKQAFAESGSEAKYTKRKGDPLIEWLTDQLALKLFSKARWDQSPRYGVLAQVLAKVKGFYQRLRASLAKLGIFRNPKIQEQLEELIAQKYWDDIDVFWATRPIASADFGLVKPIREFHQKNPSLKQKGNLINARLKAGYTGKSGRGFQKIFNYADNILRQIDTELADMFHRKIGTEGDQGFLNKKEVMTEYQAEVTQLRDSMGDDRFQKAAKEIERTDANSKLSQDAQKIKDWLTNFYESYAKPSMPTLGKLSDNYFPRVYDTQEIIFRTDEFTELVAKHLERSWKEQGRTMPQDQGYFLEMAREVARKLMDAHGVFEMEFDVPELAQGPRNIANLGRILDLGPKFEADLAKHKFVYEDRHETLMYYIAQTVKRGEAEKKFGGYFEAKGPVINGEMLMGPTMTHLIQATPKLQQLFKQRFNRPFTDYLMQVFDPGEQAVEKFLIDTGYAKRDDVFKVYRPTGHLTDAIARIREKDPVAARDAEQIISGYFGRLGADMNPGLRKAQSWAIVAQSYLTLAFSAVASLPDFAGIVMRGRNAPGMKAALKGMMQVLGDYKNKKEAARLLGMLNERAAINGILSRYGADHMSPAATKAMDFLFKYNGQEALTNFSRVMAVSAAETVLVDMARRGDTQRLGQLNLTPDEVNQWQDGTLDGRKLVKIRNAIRQYTDESILRPNAAMRPIWASDPRYALLWHLKSFVYAFGKVIMGGAIQEMRNSGKNGDYINAMLQPVMLGATFMPLAALGLFLRGIVQYDIWGGEDPYEEMATGNYLVELTKRAGFWGPFEMAYKFAQTNDTEEAFLDLAGPTLDHLHVLLSTSNTVGDKVARSVPLFSQLYGLQEAVGVK